MKYVTRLLILCLLIFAIMGCACKDHVSKADFASYVASDEGQFTVMSEKIAQGFKLMGDLEIKVWEQNFESAKERIRRAKEACK